MQNANCKVKNAERKRQGQALWQVKCEKLEVNKIEILRFTQNDNNGLDSRSPIQAFEDRPRGNDR